jgi:hypothetical protein
MSVRCRVGVILPALLALAAAALRSSAQTAWQPSPGHTQVRIWPGAVPDARPVGGPEVAGTVVDAVGNERLVGGKPWVHVDSVSQPTMTVYLPQGHATGVAVVVFPGGGHNILAIDLEGTEQRTVGLVRYHAPQWHVDPRKIGVTRLFSGWAYGGRAEHTFREAPLPAVDAADKESCRPDFAVALYPGHLAVPENDFALSPDIHVTRQTPPTFLLRAEDDPVDPVENSLVSLPGAQEGWRFGTDPLVCERRACVRTPVDLSGRARSASMVARTGVGDGSGSLRARGLHALECVRRPLMPTRTRLNRDADVGVCDRRLCDTAGSMPAQGRSFCRLGGRRRAPFPR